MDVGATAGVLTPVVGKGDGRFAPVEPAAGLPPLERLWAIADTLNAKTRKA
jgi:hypothetical protein